jgi:SMI1 / KNR4 family (SUKH-1)
MRFPKLIDNLYLADLSHRIRTLPPNEAASALFECGAIVLLAGHSEIAYQLFTSLLAGELKLSEYSSLVHPLKSILPSVCYLMGIACPAIFSEQAMPIGDLEWYIEEKSLQYKQIENIDITDEYIIKYWNSLEEVGRIGFLYWIAYLPDAMKRISEGVLQDEIKISHVQAQELLHSIDKRTYDPQQIGFIPTIEDWTEFLERWNERIFDIVDKEDEEDIEWYEDSYPEVMEYRQCLRTGATEMQIVKLEQKLQTKFPIGYRNFLLASNGFEILNRHCEIYGTDKIDWFINENQDWVDAWNDRDDEICDEQYFQYGDHQDCWQLRSKYMKTALQISSTEDGDVYLLNPLIIDRRNEWEAWDFGNKNPGAFRYRSFWDMMQKIYMKSCDKNY